MGSNPSGGIPSGSLYIVTKVIDSSVRRHTGIVPLNALADDIQACGALSGFDGPVR